MVQHGVLEIPRDSIYYWMYTQGLKHIDLDDILSECMSQGKEVRPKDIENYWNGFYRSDMYNTVSMSDNHISFGHIPARTADNFKQSIYTEFPKHPYEGMPEIETRWVPCNFEGKPLYKWSAGCQLKADAKATRGCVTLAENLKGTKFIVIDCDGDHDKSHLDYEAIKYLAKYIPKTHALMKTKLVKEYGPVPSEYERLAELPASFHLTFAVDRLIPTMHFPEAHMDLIGNAGNSLRYLKTKVHNGLEPIPMTDEIWDDLKKYVEERKKNHGDV